MSSLQAQDPNKSRERSKFARSFDRAVGLARWTGFAERVWDRAAPTVGGLTGVFLTASWAGLWQYVTPSVKMTGVALFAAGLTAAIAPLRKVRFPGRDEALARLDRNTGLPDRLAATYDDIPDDKDMDRESRVVWDIQRSRIQKKVGRFKVGGPKSTLKERDPYNLRYALALAAGLSFCMAASQGESVDRLTSAFDWKLETMTNTAKIDAWITPPDYAGQEQVPLSSREGGPVALDSDVSVPAGSTVTLRVHEPNASVTVQGGATPVEEACRTVTQDGATSCEFKLASNTGITVNRRGEGRSVTWTINVTPDRPPVISVNSEADEQEGKERVTYTVKDEFGAEISGTRIKPAEPADPEAKPLPVYNLPKMTLPR